MLFSIARSRSREQAEQRARQASVAADLDRRSGELAIAEHQRPQRAGIGLDDGVELRRRAPEGIASMECLPLPKA